jgi:RNA polymerase sigma factor (sigma-70 family)
MKQPQDDGWFKAIYDLHRRRIFRRCFWYVKNQEDAEDITAETFLKAFADSRFSTLDEDHQKNWLLLASKRLCFSKLGRPTIEIPSGDFGDDPIPEPADPAPTPEDEAIYEDLSEELSRKLALLSNEERVAVMMKAQECTLEQIAETLACSIAKASYLCKRALAKLKRLYDDDKGQ